MSPIVQLIKAFVPHFPTQQELDEAYLSEATDIYDVERRIFEIDHRERTLPWQTPAFNYHQH